MKRSLLTALCSLLPALPAFAILDVNSNGVSDFWERAFNNGSLFAESFDPQADDDSDGWTNAQEAAAGTNPFDPNPPDGLIRPGIIHTPAVWGEDNGVPYIDTPEAVTVTWPTIPGKRYRLLVSADLSQGSWIEVPDSDFISNGNIPEFHFTTAESDKLFWRVAVEDADSDGDGLTNHEEHLAGTDPYLPDTDGDTVSDHTEMIEGTDPNHADADYDGMEDRWETAHGLDPTDWYDAYDDPDGDGIQNQFEYVLGFHPTVANPAELTADRDNDGMPDYWEAQTGSFQWSYATQKYEFQRMLDWENPADAAQDPDSDDLTNLAEYQNTTNPFDWDTDYDYLPDGWEIQHGLVAAYQIQDNGTWIYGSNGINGSTGDPDSDGIQNQFEYVLGFHPMVADPTGQTADRDNDGMPDFWEAQTGSFQWSSQSDRHEFVRTLDWDNPADASQDADADGLANLAEYQNSTDPLDWDTDYDYLPDGWEIQHGLVAAYRIQVNGSWVYGSSGPNGRTGDPDSDGIQNQYEYVLGFHPTTANPAELTADRDNDGMPDLWEAQTGSFKWSSQNQRYEFQRNFDWENSADAAQDPDGDGLPNLAEYQNTTNPFDYDTDGDNLSDGWEIQYGFNPKSTASPNGATDDPDGDGIENQYEQALGFHPTIANAAELTADRDNDGMPDAWEAATSEGRHTSPETGTGITRLIRALDWEIDDSAEDYDSDGLANLLEYQAGLGVADPDSDDDLLPDGWEILYGFDPFTPSSDALTADPDGDGYSNFLEAIMGTDPYDNTSYPPTPPGNNIPGTPYPGGGTNPTTPPTPPSPNTGTAQWSFEAVTSSKKLPKHGYAEFSPTAPPKRYLKLLESVSFGLHGECDPPESRIDGTRLTTVNPLDGTQQVDDRQHPGNNNMGGTTTAQSPVVAVGISQVTSYDDDPNSESDCDATKTYTLNLSQENTTEQLIANTRAQLPAYQSSYASWRTPHAYRNLDDDELGLAYQKCRYRIKWQSGTAEEDRHRLTWLVVFQPETPAGQTEAPAPEILRSHQWDGTSETSPEYELDPETEKPGEDGSYYLVTVDVAVKLKGHAISTTGLLVKTGDVLQFALNPDLFYAQDKFESSINWQYRQRKADGDYEPWTNFGTHGTGTTFEHATATGGVFQIRTVIANAGEHEYNRKKDEKIDNFAYGRGKKYEPDFVGVCDTQIQIDICREAQSFYGDTSYEASNIVPAQYGFPEYPASGNSIIRCNIFVAHRATAAGAVVPKINGVFNEYPPLANEWAGIEDTSIWPGDPTYIAGWPILPASTYPQPGWIVAHPNPGDAGHCAITDYDGEGIGAGVSGTVNKNYNLAPETFWDGTSRFRKYTP